MKAILGEVSGVQCDDEIGLSLFSAHAENLVSRIRRNLGRRGNFYVCGAFSNQFDDPADQIGTDAEATQDFLVLVHNVICHEPNKVGLLGPPVEQVSAGIFASGLELSEAGDSCN